MVAGKWMREGGKLFHRCCNADSEFGERSDLRESGIAIPA
jgi:hypothetical protein